jgi:hypothetical protein
MTARGDKGVEFERYLRHESKVHILTHDNRAAGDKARMCPMSFTSLEQSSLSLWWTDPPCTLRASPPIPFGSFSTLSVRRRSSEEYEKSRFTRHQRSGQFLHESIGVSHIGKRAGRGTHRGIQENQGV